MEISRALKPNGKFYSRSFSDQLYIGKKNNQLSPFEFDNISDGPLADKGFLRLIDKTEINRLYGEVFAFESIDLAEYTQNNGSISISEWHITCTKK